MKPKNAIRRGRPVEPPPGATSAHEFVTPDGRRVVIARRNGKILPGARLCDLREPGDVGVESRRPDSVTRTALGLQTPVTEWRHRKRNGGTQ